MPSILHHGILSHLRANSVPHDSLAKQEVQDIRAGKRVTQGLPLYDYANLYVTARNPMLFKRQDEHSKICVLRVEPRVLDIPGAVVTDGNAASRISRFAAAPEGLTIVDHGLTFAEWWTDNDPIRLTEKKRAKCAEILVPAAVPPEFITGAYVSSEESRKLLLSYGSALTVEVNRHLFFFG